MICSNEEDKINSIREIEDKFVRSGYSVGELQESKRRALSLNRQEILANHRKKIGNVTENILTCVINHDPHMAKLLKGFFHDHKNQLDSLIGNKRIIVSERRSPNTSSLLYAKSTFSQAKRTNQYDQRCGSGYCKTCKENLPLHDTILLWTINKPNPDPF